MESMATRTWPAAAKILSESLGVELSIASEERISAPDRRNQLFRLHLAAAPGRAPSSVILKQALPTEGRELHVSDALASDSAGLEFLASVPGAEPHAPRFYGADVAAGFLLMEDLGPVHHSLVGILLRPGNAEAATRALTAYVRRLGKMHADTWGKTDAYDRTRAKWHRPAFDWRGILERFERERAPALLATLSGILGALPEGLEREMVDVMRSTLEPGPFTVFLQGDACPDNTFIDPGTGALTLIDFEYSRAGHALLEGCYPRLAMPSCWCARAIPEPVLRELEDVYRRELATTVVAAREDAPYVPARAKACAGWTLTSLSQRLAGCLAEDELWTSGPVEKDSSWAPEHNRHRSRILTQLTATASGARSARALPALCDAFERLYATLTARWQGARPLGLYPAFSRAPGNGP